MTTREIEAITHGDRWPDRDLVEGVIGDLEALVEDGEADEDDQLSLKLLHEFNAECASAVADWQYGD